MSYEEPSFIAVDPEGYVHDGPEAEVCELAKSWIDECNHGDDGFGLTVESVKVALLTHIPASLEENHELQPTPEWQRIQEQLKTGERNKSLVEQAESDRDFAVMDLRRVTDELESVKAELELYKSKTPHTADGKPIFVGDTVYREWYGDDRPEVLVVISIGSLLLDGDTDYGYTIGTKNRNCINTELYSSREALEAAMKVGES